MWFRVKRARRMAQAVECLPHMYKPLSRNPSKAIRRRRRRRRIKTMLSFSSPKLYKLYIKHHVTRKFTFSTSQISSYFLKNMIKKRTFWESIALPSAKHTKESDSLIISFSIFND
jgi:hypothetical protein